MFRGALRPPSSTRRPRGPRRRRDRAPLTRLRGFDGATRGRVPARRRVPAGRARRSRPMHGARAAGADLRFGERVARMGADGDGGVRVRTASAASEADRLVICGRRLDGPPRSRASPGWPSRSDRSSPGSRPRVPDAFAAERFPVFLIDVAEGSYYGFPTHDGHGFKFGRYHHFGEPIDPDDPDRSTRPDDEAALRAFARALPPRWRGTDRDAEGLHLHEHARRALHPRPPA